MASANWSKGYPCYGWRRIVRAALLLLVANVLASCSTDHSKPKETVTTPVPQGSPTGYLLVEPDRVQFIQWTEISNELHGNIQVVYVTGPDDFTVLPQNFSFTGTHAGANVSFSVDQGGHASITWTGAISGNNLTIVSPTGTG